FEFGEAELFVKPMGVACREHPAAKALEFGMCNDRSHQLFAYAAAAIFLYHEHVAAIRERRFVTDDACECDLPFAVIYAETDRIFYRGFCLFKSAVPRPV